MWQAAAVLVRDMPAIAEIDNPPASVLNGLGSLRGALDTTVPAKASTHLLVGTWNIRAFGNLTPKWRTDASDSPKRNLADLVAIGEIVSRFDVCAVQETRGNLTALRTLMRRLGADWGFVVTDVGEGEAANDERLAYVFDRRRVRFSGLAGELVIAEQGSATTRPRCETSSPGRRTWSPSKPAPKPHRSGSR